MFWCGWDITRSDGFSQVFGRPDAYTKEQLVTLHSQIVSNLEQVWELTGGSEDQLTGVMVQISQAVAREFRAGE